MFLLSSGYLDFLPRHKLLGHFKALEEIKDRLHHSCLPVRHSVRLANMEMKALSQTSPVVYSTTQAAIPYNKADVEKMYVKIGNTAPVSHLS
jgi:hypothetical protein